MRRNERSFSVKLIAPRIPPQSKATLPTSFNNPPFCPNSVSMVTSLFQRAKRSTLSQLKKITFEVKNNNKKKIYKWIDQPNLSWSASPSSFIGTIGLATDIAFRAVLFLFQGLIWSSVSCRILQAYILINLWLCLLSLNTLTNKVNNLNRGINICKESILHNEPQTYIGKAMEFHIFLNNHTVQVREIRTKNSKKTYGLT